MVSLATERWPDTILPYVIENMVNTIRTTITIRSCHLFDAWEQMSLELSKIQCEVICYFNEDVPLKKILFYGTSAMPTKIHENVSKCNIRGMICGKNGIIDDVIAKEDAKYRCYTGYRVTPDKIHRLEIRTQNKTLSFDIQKCTHPTDIWFLTEASDTVSCWLWSVCQNENKRVCNRKEMLISMQSAGMISDKNINIICKE